MCVIVWVVTLWQQLNALMAAATNASNIPQTNLDFSEWLCAVCALTADIYCALYTVHYTRLYSFFQIFMADSGGVQLIAKLIK